MTTQGGQPVTLVSAQPTTLLVGDRKISIDDWPLARTVNENRPVQVALSNDRLVIEPKARSGAGQIVGVAFMFLSAVAFPSLVVSLVGLPVWLAVLISVGVIGVLVLLVRTGFASMRWITFDRRARQLVFERRVGFRNQRRIECTYPLDTVRAVQLLHSGRHSVSESQGAGEQQAMSYREFDSYELNLVLDDSAVRRLNLASLSDWQWIRETGGRIAEFLGVPLIDELYHGG
jgi:hypothetical protein